MSPNLSQPEVQYIIEETVPEECDRLRLDIFLAAQIEDYTRSFLQKMVKEKRVRVNGRVCGRPSRAVAAGDVVRAEIPVPPPISLKPENLPLDIHYQDEDVLVVNKASGMVVHPAPGHDDGTLMNAILYHCPDFQLHQDPNMDHARPGIVHRLDRNTSGLLVVAKSERAFAELGRQAREHEFDRRYLALVCGEVDEEAGRIEAPVGRSLHDPTRMTVTSVRSRPAVTHFEVLERFGVASLVSVRLETGRTHQIRVHFRFIGHPVLGDPEYGTTDYADWPIRNEAKQALKKLSGQALHAERLGFVHPATGEKMVFAVPPPLDFEEALEALRASCRAE